MTDTWDGRPQNPERDSDGHVWRVDGDIDVYRWVAADQWYRDHKDRWVSPIDLIEEGDTYLGRIVSPAEVEARVAAARREGIEAAAKVAYRKALEAREAQRQYARDPRPYPGSVDEVVGNEAEMAEVIEEDIRALLKEGGR